MEFDVFDGYQIEIKKEIAEKLGFVDGVEVEQSIEGDCLVIRKREQ
jgi:hypothetical protein